MVQASIDWKTNIICILLAFIARFCVCANYDGFPPISQSQVRYPIPKPFKYKICIY